MARKSWLCFLLLGLWGSAVTAEEQTIALGRYVPGTDGFSGGVATADPLSDTETVHWHRRCCRPFYYGYSYSYYYYPGPVYYSFYRPGFSVGYTTFYTPRFYLPPVYYYPGYSFGYYGYPLGFCPIGLKEKVGVAANILDLVLRAKSVADAFQQPPGMAAPVNPPASVPPSAPSVEVPVPDRPTPRGQFRYDGGPENPVPLPAPTSPGPGRQLPTPTPQSPGPMADDPGTLQVSFPAPAVRSPYRYRAFGDK
jgi:hypothetical protein